jgi:hypothetical protein
VEGGMLLRRLQRGETLSMPESRPMPTIGPRCHELRVDDEGQAMNRAQKERFEKAGWKIGTASELLGLTEAEEALVEAKLKLGAVVRTLRLRRHLSQRAGDDEVFQGLIKKWGTGQAYRTRKERVVRPTRGLPARPTRSRGRTRSAIASRRGRCATARCCCTDRRQAFRAPRARRG